MEITQNRKYILKCRRIGKKENYSTRRKLNFSSVAQLNLALFRDLSVRAVEFRGGERDDEAIVEEL